MPSGQPSDIWEQASVWRYLLRTPRTVRIKSTRLHFAPLLNREYYSVYTSSTAWSRLSLRDIMMYTGMAIKRCFGAILPAAKQRTEESWIRERLRSAARSWLPFVVRTRGQNWLFAAWHSASATASGCMGKNFRADQTSYSRRGDGLCSYMGATGMDTGARKVNFPSRALGIGLRRSRPIERGTRGTLLSFAPLDGDPW